VSVARCRVRACGARARVSRQPHAPRQPRPRAAPGRLAFSGQRQRCSIDAVCGRARAGAGARVGPRKRGTGRAGHEMRNGGRGKPSLPQH
jgi:hypothetical protein